MYPGRNGEEIVSSKITTGVGSQAKHQNPLFKQSDNSTAALVRAAQGWNDLVPLEEMPLTHQGKEAIVTPDTIGEQGRGKWAKESWLLNFLGKPSIRITDTKVPYQIHERVNTRSYQRNSYPGTPSSEYGVSFPREQNERLLNIIVPIPPISPKYQDMNGRTSNARA